QGGERQVVRDGRPENGVRQRELVVVHPGEVGQRAEAAPVVEAVVDRDPDGRQHKAYEERQRRAQQQRQFQLLAQPPRAPEGWRLRGPCGDGDGCAGGPCHSRRHRRVDGRDHYEVEAAWFTVWMIVAGEPCPAKKFATALSTAWPTLVGKAMSK